MTLLGFLVRTRRAAVRRLWPCCGAGMGPVPVFVRRAPRPAVPAEVMGWASSSCVIWLFGGGR